MSGDGVGVVAGVRGPHDRFGRIVAVGQEEPDGRRQCLEHVGAVVDVRHRLGPGNVEETPDFTDAVGEADLAKLSVGSPLDAANVGKVRTEHIGEFIEEADGVERGSVGAGESGDGISVHDAGSDCEPVSVGDNSVAGGGRPQGLEVGGVTQPDGGGTHGGAVTGRRHPGAMPGPTIGHPDDGLNRGVGHVAARADSANQAGGKCGRVGLLCFEERPGGLQHELGVAAVAANPRVLARRRQAELADLAVAFTDLFRGEPFYGASEGITDRSTEQGALRSIVGDDSRRSERSGGALTGRTGGNQTAIGKFCIDVGVGMGFRGVGHGAPRLGFDDFCRNDT